MHCKHDESRYCLCFTAFYFSFRPQVTCSHALLTTVLAPEVISQTNDNPIRLSVLTGFVNQSSLLDFYEYLFIFVYPHVPNNSILKE